MINIMQSILLGLVISVILGFIIIPSFSKRGVKQSLSEYLREEHIKKSGTPTMGGIIFVLATLFSIIILYFIGLIDISYNFIIVISIFFLYALIGFIDDYLIVVKKNNKGLSENAKLILQTIIAVIFFYLFLKADNEPLFWIQSLNIKIEAGFLYGVFILLVLIASSNAVNLTDGLDGLATTLSIIVFTTLGIITHNTPWLEGYLEISMFCFSLVGSLIGFLFFNINPAKIFMGDTGSLALGATMGAIAILDRRELLLVIIGGVFVIETTTCIIQRYYYKLTKKRFFLMTPIHHSFEKKGWSERDIVKLFSLFGLIFALIALIIGG